MTSEFERVQAKAEWKTYIERNRDTPVKLWMVDGMIELVFEHCTRKNAELVVRVEELEKRPVSGVSYTGAFDNSKEYGAGTLVTRSGALWLAVRTSCGESPGTTPVRGASS